MVKKKAAVTKNDSPIAIKTGGKDIIGQKPLIPKINNNFLYGGLGLVLLVGGAVITNPRLLQLLPGQRPPAPPAVVSAPPMTPSGQAVTIQGVFNPPVPQAWYVVNNAQGQPVTSGSLGNNVSQYSQVIPSLPDGQYTVVVSDSPPITSGPQGPGTIFPTTAVLQQGLTGTPPSLGPASSGPESISLS